MPAIIGNIKIVSVEGAAIVNVGDCLILAPSSTSKAFAGGGSFNTGDFARLNTGITSTNTNDPDVADSNII